MATSQQTRVQQPQAGGDSRSGDPRVTGREQARRRTNLRSSAVGAVAGSVVVALLAAIDPATPWTSVGLRAAAAFALGGAAGLTLSAVSERLHSLRSRTATHESAGLRP